ncbi:MAG: glycosyltransferase family 39 protein, partial [Candidatus Omnitrophica bacterium]|nr:glycosyltransferase family 39 protein [Candidatus Omnitrophota bacterium]
MIQQKTFRMVLLAAVILLGAYLRTASLSDSDFICVDEYMYFNGAAIGNTVRAAIFDPGAMIKNGGIGALISRSVKTLPLYARPGYHVISAVATVFIGESKHTALLVSAVFGVMMLIIVYLITYAMFGSYRMALVASLFLATQSGDVFYSRSAYQTPGAVFFLALSLFLYIRHRTAENKSFRYLVMSAAAYGISFSIHPAVAYAAPLFVLLEAIRSAKTLVRNLLVFFGTLFSIIILWEVPRFLVYLYFLFRGRIARGAGYFESLVPINNIMSYIAELTRVGKAQSAFRLDPGSFGYFPGFLIHTQGIIYFIIVVAALAYVIFRLLRRKGDYRYVLLSAWPLLIYI